MPFKFSFSSSTSASFVSSSSTNGQEAAKGYAYRHEAYSNEHGTGSRTTKQKLGQAPVTETRMYDAQGRPLLIQGTHESGSANVSNIDDSRRIEDVTDQEDTKMGNSSQ